MTCCCFQITMIIDKVDLGSKFLLSCIKVYSTLGKSYGPYGINIARFRKEQVNVSGKVLRHIAGSSGDALDSLTFFFA